jgi:hypothetical protein
MVPEEERTMTTKTPYRATLVFWPIFLMLAWLMPASSQGASGQLNAFYLTSLPATYDQQERFFKSLREGGANAVILAPDKADRLPDLEVLPNIVFLAHEARLKIYFVLPVRSLPAVLQENPEWEDMRYDLGSGTIQPTGRLDLFNPAVVEYLAAAYREIASYSVDGILFGVDFYYGDAEGMSRLAMDEYEKRHDKALIISRAITKTEKVDGGYVAVGYGEGYQEWTTLKKERLVETLRAVIAAARTVNKSIAFGIPLHMQGLNAPEDAFRKYAYDMNDFQAIPLDFYWTAIMHRKLREQQGFTSYKKSLDELGRISRSANESVKESTRVIIVLQTGTGSRLLPLSEIEEATAVTRKSGDANIAYKLDPYGTLSAQFSKKLFRRDTNK